MAAQRWGIASVHASLGFTYSIQHVTLLGLQFICGATRAKVQQRLHQPHHLNSCSLCLGLYCFCALSRGTDIGLDERPHSKPIETYSFSTTVHHYPISSPKFTRPTPQACPTIHPHALALSPPLSLSLISSTLLGTILPLPSPSGRSSSACISAHAGLLHWLCCSSLLLPLLRLLLLSEDSCDSFKCHEAAIVLGKGSSLGCGLVGV